jgi:hypothetical protein
VTLPAPPPLGGDQLDVPSAAPPPDDDPILGAYGPRPEPPADAPGVAIGPDEVTGFLVGCGDALAALRGDHWRIEPGETALMAPAISRQLSTPGNPLAEWIAAHADAFLILVGAGIIVAPRLIIEYQVIRYRREMARLYRDQQEAGVPIYEHREPEPVPGRGAAAEPPGGGAGGGVRPGGNEERAFGVPTDPGALAAATAVLGRS